jgi:hypothetical protein
MIDGLTVAGLSDTGAQLKHHKSALVPEGLAGSAVIEIATRPKRRAQHSRTARNEPKIRSHVIAVTSSPITTDHRLIILTRCIVATMAKINAEITA